MNLPGKIAQLFPSFQKELVKDIEEQCIIKEVKAGDIIMKTGQYIRHTVLVISGRLKIYREDDEGKEFFLYYLQPGQACAISMICATRAQTSQVMAKAEEDGELLMLPLPLMEQWMAAYKSWYEFVIETYRNRFEEVLVVLDQVAFRSMDERLEFYLKRNIVNNGDKTVYASHQEIANDLSTSREVISRLLKKMEQRGLVKLHRNYIELLHPL